MMKPTHFLHALALFACTVSLTAAPVEQAALTQPGNFGEAVAISGDTMVVGALRANVGGVAAGAAYVYVRSGGTWTQQAVLTASNPNANDYFGQAVAISGDRIAVGAPREASNATGISPNPTGSPGNQADNSVFASGAVYLFTRSGTTWTQQAYLKAPKAQQLMGFGVSVAISGTTLVVGSGVRKQDWAGPNSLSYYGDDSGATGVNGNLSDNSSPRAGAVFVYQFSGSLWYLDAYLKASNTNNSDAFGSCVATDGNLIVVGAPGEASAATGVNSNQADNSVPWAGAAYVFGRGANGVWAQEAYLKADVQYISSSGYGIGFGLFVAVSGDTVAVGCGFNDDDFPGGGKAWVFTRSGAGVWAQQQVLTPLLNTGTYFGFSVALSGDTLVVGEPILADPWVTPSSGFGTGDAHVFTRTAGVWTRQAVINPSNPQKAIGCGLAIDGGTFVVGAGGIIWSGAINQAWVFTGAGQPDIALEQPAGVALASSGTTSIAAVPGTPTDTVFTIRNTGPAALNLTGTPNRVALSGSSDFSITAQPTTTVSPSGSTTFTVRFAPATAGLKTATLSIPSDDPDESPYVINLSGRGLSFTTDTDGDGMSDAAEFQLAPQGFDWQVAQSALVANYFANANNNGLYTTAQVQALNVGVPLLQRNPATGKFTLTIGVKKTAVLGQPFSDFPMSGPGTNAVINGAGKVEFEFPAPGNAAFFRLESQ